MAEEKVDLTDGHLILEKLDNTLTPKGTALEVNVEEKVLMGFFDDSKDEMKTETAKPLSPQWLYAKPCETKPGISCAPGDAHATNSLTCGSSTDSHSEVGCLDESQDKKESRRVAPELESSRRWRDEERDTGLLSRKDCRKDDRYTVSNKEIAEDRVLTSSDRWNDVGSRNYGGPETRRDGKWSLRWGPEHRDSSWAEKKTCTHKEDSVSDKQSLVSSNHETDTRGKWRPRHWLDVHSGRPVGYRTAPGLGIERGRLEGSNLGFPPGRGRSSRTGSPSLSRSSTPPIGASVDKSAEIYEKTNIISDKFRYPRSKLLDIYRKQRLLSSFNDVPEGLEEVPTLKQPVSVEPLAFVAPDAEEEAVLVDIWKGKLRNCGIVSNPSTNNIVKSSGNMTGNGEAASTQKKYGMHIDNNSEETHEGFANVAKGDVHQGAGIGVVFGHASNTSVLDATDLEECETVDTIGLSGRSHDSNAVALKSESPTGVKNYDAVLSNAKDGEYMQSEHATLLKHSTVENVESFAPVGISTKYPEDLVSLLDVAHVGNEQCSKSKEEANLLETGPALDELSLYYKDPQGNIQGPFLGTDIILWFSQNYFGADLPVCPSDAPEGTPFQDLGSVMPHLKTMAKSSTKAKPISSPELSDAVGDTGAGSSAALEFHDSTALTGPQLATSDIEDVSVHCDYSGMSKNEDFMFSAQPGNIGSQPTTEASSKHYDSPMTALDHPLTENGATEISVPNNKDDKLHPSGLLSSEFEGNHQNHLLSTMTSGSEQYHHMDTNVLQETPLMSHEHHSFAARAGNNHVGDAWSDNHRIDTLPNCNLLQEAVDDRQFIHSKQDTIDLSEKLSYPKLENMHLRKQNRQPPQPAVHSSGSFVQSAGPFQSNYPAQHRTPFIQQMQDSITLWKHRIQRLYQFEVQKRQLEQQRHMPRGQVNQLILDQLVHQRMQDPGYAHRAADYQIPQNTLEQVILGQNSPHEGQQHFYPPSKHPLLLDQLTQAKYDQGMEGEPHGDMAGQMLPFELPLHLQQEQLQASYHSMSSRANTGTEEERSTGAVWPVDETGQFVSSSSNPPLAYQHQMRHFPHEQDLFPLDKTRLLPAAGNGIHLDAVNAFTRGQDLDLWEWHNQMNIARKISPSTSGIHSHHLQVPHQFYVSNIDASESHSSEHLRKGRDTSMQRQIEQEKRELEENMPCKDRIWLAAGDNVESSKLDLLHHQAGLQHPRSDEVCRGSLTSVADFLYDSNSSDGFYNNHQFGLRSSILEGPQHSNLSKSVQDQNVNAGRNAQSSSLESGDSLLLKSHCRPLPKEQFSLGMDESNHDLQLHAHSSLRGELSVATEPKDDNHGVRGGYRSRVLGNNPTFDVQGRIIERSGTSTKNNLELPSGGVIKNHTPGHAGVNLGVYDNDMGTNTLREDTAVRRMESVFFKAYQNSVLASAFNGKNTTDVATFDEGRLEYEVNSQSKACDSLAPWTEMGLLGNPDVCEKSVVGETVKRSSKKLWVPTESNASTGAVESADTAQEGRGGKKKGKKGRQIDPTLLGFKVSSNRPLMGEIRG